VSLSLNDFQSVSVVFRVWCCIDSEAYTSGLSYTPGCPAEILHCSFFERHFWKCRQSNYHWFY